MRIFGELRNWFLIVLAVGTLGIIAGWLLDSVLLTFGVPLTSMAAYLFPGYRDDRSLFTTYVFADSFYFLGFLFTLISLFVSLLAFAQGDPTAEQIAGTVSRFGVALATTVVGLGVRVYLVNFRPEMDDSVIQAEKSLADSSQTFRAQLDRLNADLVVQTEGWTASLTHAISTANAELQAAYESGGKAVKAASEQLAEATRTRGEAISKAFDGLVKRLDSIEVSEDALTRSLQPALAKLTASLTSCAGAVDAVQIDPGAAIEALESLAEAARRSAKEARELAGSFSALDTGRLSSVAAEYSAALVAVNEALQAQQESLVQIEAGLRQDVSLTSEYRAQLQQQVDASKAALTEVSTSMVDAARYVVTALKER